MHPFVKLLNIFLGKEPIPSALQDAMAKNDSLKFQIEGGIALGSNLNAVNWQALIALLIQLAPLIIPLLGG